MLAELRAAARAEERERKKRMKTLDYQQAYDLLHKAGCTFAEIDRLIRLRQTYQPTEMDEAPLDERRLEFARWLVLHGKLSESLNSTG